MMRSNYTHFPEFELWHDSEGPNSQEIQPMYTLKN